MSFTISQNLFIGDPTIITVVKCNDDAVNMECLQPFLYATNSVLGVSATYGKHCQLSSIAFSTLLRALVVNVSARHVYRSKHPEKQRVVARGRSLIQDCLLVNSAFQKYAFMMDQLAVALYLDMSIRIRDAVDMLSVATNNSRRSLQALMDAMGGEPILQKQNVQSPFFTTSKSPTVDPATRVALQAWVACRAATLPHMSSRFASLPMIDTMAFRKAHLIAIATISRQAERLEALKPTCIKNEVTDQFTMKKDIINLICARFLSRIKKSKDQVIQVELENEGATSRVIGRARKVNGRSAHISVDAPLQGDKILSVSTIGKENPTFAESTRQVVILETLQHKTSILSNPFFQALWLPKERLVWPQSKGRRVAIPVDSSCNLNASQCAAVQKILSNKNGDRIVLIQGPPGTGKTTVIATSVISHDGTNSSQSIWVSAKSNVAVKNIAGKLIKEGFCAFKLIVSKDFHFDWHEHLHAKLEPCLIRTDRLARMSIVDAERLLHGCKVILCTLSMLSTPMIDLFLHIVPVEVLISDEASQVECGDLLPIFYRFHSRLSKFVLIVPPYGKEDIPDLHSIFEFSHLRRRGLFLDIQYRMPHVIGSLISRNVCGGKLLTCHPFMTSRSCYFVDVSKGQETKPGHSHSWINREEARVVVKLAQLYEWKNMSFRIITPYDSQRSLIENNLKSEKLKWEDKVFNVDSFQGNEDDHIIISVVRSERLGFLKNERRTNVMLTRCKQSMVICSNRAFLSDEAPNTLIGKLAASHGKGRWIQGDDVLKGRATLLARDLDS